MLIPKPTCSVTNVNINGLLLRSLSYPHSLPTPRVIRGTPPTQLNLAGEPPDEPANNCGVPRMTRGVGSGGDTVIFSNKVLQTSTDTMYVTLNSFFFAVLDELSSSSFYTF